ncbi:hypothetical protein QAD02_002927 [Eretmocerus hayati]|uniref:Uncharacterized protein n=1 Tax=Eretmocerus hayati TaxID=131215 RepID=A0ACC2NLA3_9HYME|nr:hypothetical protein QAD02_002927 [Eretmocerus hayati]
MDSQSGIVFEKSKDTYFYGPRWELFAHIELSYHLDVLDKVESILQETPNYAGLHLYEDYDLRKGIVNTSMTVDNFKESLKLLRKHSAKQVDHKHAIYDEDSILKILRNLEETNESITVDYDARFGFFINKFKMTGTLNHSKRC